MKNTDEKQNDRGSYLVFVNNLEVSKTDNFGTFKVSLSRQELSNERRMTSVRQCLIFEHNDEVQEILRTSGRMQTPR